MDIEQEFVRVFEANYWGSFPLVVDDVSARGHRLFYRNDEMGAVSCAGMAQLDYNAYKRYTVYGKEKGDVKCVRVRELVAANLLLCLTSTHPYIREWGRLVKEELEEMSMWDGKLLRSRVGR